MIPIQPDQIKRLILIQDPGVIIQVDSEAFMQKISGGIAEEEAELIYVNDFPFLRRLGEARRNKRRRFLALTRCVPGCLVIFPGIADEFPAFLEILRAESLEAVFDDYVVRYFSIMDFIGLIDIIQEFAYQNGGRPGAVILNALPHVADVEPLPG